MSGIINRTGAGSGVIGTTEQNSSLVYLGSSRSSSIAGSVIFDGFGSTDYICYKIIGLVQTDTNQDALKMRLRANGSTITGAYWYGSQGYGDASLTTSWDDNGSYWRITNNMDIDFASQIDLTLRFENNPNQSKAITLINGQIGLAEYDDKWGWRMFFGIYSTSNTAIDGILLDFTTGSMACHDIGVWGMKG